MGKMRRHIKIWLLAIPVMALLVSCPARALTLKESIGAALKNNPSVLAAQKKLDAAGARLNQAVGAFFPTIKLSGSYSSLYSDPQVIQVTIPGASTQTFSVGAATGSKSWTASFSQPLFEAGLLPGFKMARLSADIAAEEFNKIRQNTAYNVTTAYFGVLSADKLAQVADDSLHLANSHFKQVQAMLNSGVATRADFLRAEVQVANSEVALTRMRNALELAKNSFNNILGRSLDAPALISEEAAAVIPILPDYGALVKNALVSRPDWKKFICAKNIAEENLALARTSYLPSVKLNGQTGNQVTDYSSFQSSLNSWSVTGSASWTLFDGLGRENRINEAAADLAAERANEDQIRNGIALEVRDAFLSLKSVIDSIGSAKKAVDFAAESYKVSSLRFESGVGTNVEVIDAQVVLAQAKTNYLKALFDLNVSKARINNVVGQEVL
ncbi:TolC family protein [Candidatus Saganbacteria bacterium]|nr:TolC family protein [Candidatus Saganbacteria bacterium]